MAVLQIENGESFENLDSIAKELKELNIDIALWPYERSERLSQLLSADQLEESEKEELLAQMDDRFEKLKTDYGYQSRDLIVLHSKTPKLNEMLSIFDKIHTHDDDEVRYIVDGSGSFGFVKPNGVQCLLTLFAGEYIRIPKNTKHWFVLDDQKRIKAVRYFTGKDGWVANYTEDKVRV